MLRIWVQKSASIQKRTSPLKFGDLAEISGLNSVSNLSIKVQPAVPPGNYSVVVRAFVERFDGAECGIFERK